MKLLSAKPTHRHIGVSLICCVLLIIGVLLYQTSAQEPGRGERVVEFEIGDLGDIEGILDDADTRSPTAIKRFLILPPFATSPQMVYDDVNHNVGIGTASPTARLELSNLGTDGGLYLNGNTQVKIITTQDTGTDSLRFAGQNANKNAALYIVPGGDDKFSVLSLSSGPSETTVASLEHDGRAGELVTRLDLLGPTHDRFLIRNDSGTEIFSVKSSGNVGIGIPNPQAKLHIGGTPSVDGIMFPDGTVQTAAALPVTSVDGLTGGTVFGTITTDGLVIPNGRIAIRDPDNQVDRLVIGGFNIDIFDNPTSTIRKLSLSDSGIDLRNDQGDAVGEIDDNGPNPNDLRIRNPVGGQINLASQVFIGTDGGHQRNLIVDGNVTADAYLTSSSKRWKTNIKSIENALDKIQHLRGVSYDWKADGRDGIGLIAEEVGKVLPEIVTYEKNGVDAQSVAYARLVAVLIEGIKEQQHQIETLKAANAKQEAKMSQFETTLQELSARLVSLETEGSKATGE